MHTAAWTFSVLIFVVVTSVSLLAGLLWSRQDRRQQRARVAARLERLGGRGAGAGEPPTRLVLRTAPRAGGRGLASMHRIEALLAQAGVAWGVRGWLLRTVASAAGAGALLLLLTASPVLALAAMAAAGSVPFLLLRRARARRRARFEAAFPDTVDLLSRSIRAGHPLTAGLKMVAEEAPSPIAEEFQRVFDEQKFGLSLHESLESLAARIDLPDLRIFVTAVNIQREVGGNLAEILDGIAETIRERFKIVRQVRTYTAQGRMTGILLGALPAGLGLLLGLLNPEYMLILLREPGGRMLLAGAAGLQLIGFWVVRRVTMIEV